MIEHIIKLLTEIHLESEYYGRFSLNLHTARAAIGEMLENQNYFIRVTDHGVIIGSLCKPFWSDDVIAQDEFVYVSKEGRGLGEGVKLIAAFEKWAIERGARRIIVGDSMGISDKALSIYRKNGYNDFAIVMAKEIK